MFFEPANGPRSSRHTFLPARARVRAAAAPAGPAPTTTTSKRSGMGPFFRWDWHIEQPGEFVQHRRSNRDPRCAEGRAHPACHLKEQAELCGALEPGAPGKHPGCLAEVDCFRGRRVEPGDLG